MDPIVLIVGIAFAGPIVGSVIGVMRRPTFVYVCCMLCFAAGVMLAISFMELIPESVHLSSIPGSVLGLLSGALVMYGLDRLLPHLHPSLCNQEQGCNLERSSLYLIIGIFLHNFPEGMAIASGAVANVRASIIIALAIAIHNIPEGICTSASYFHASGNRTRAFLLSCSTAFPILVGFFVARYVFNTIAPQVVGFLVAATAGLMIYITVDELIPNSCAGDNHQTIFSFIIGVVLVMLLQLV
ncbi:MAG: ZIP family metal transporter [Thermodesulfobacteriota bacterium]|nr:ZIP family metal transporter [Thermodesulfobacteriota bacterium]